MQGKGKFSRAQQCLGGFASAENTNKGVPMASELKYA